MFIHADLVPDHPALTVVIVLDQPLSRPRASQSSDDFGRNVSDCRSAVLLAIRFGCPDYQGQDSATAATSREPGLVAQLVGHRIRAQTHERDLLDHTRWRVGLASRETKPSGCRQNHRIDSRHWVSSHSIQQKPATAEPAYLFAGFWFHPRRPYWISL